MGHSEVGDAAADGRGPGNARLRRRCIGLGASGASEPGVIREGLRHGDVRPRPQLLHSKRIVPSCHLNDSNGSRKEIAVAF